MDRDAIASYQHELRLYAISQMKGKAVYQPLRDYNVDVYWDFISDDFYSIAQIKLDPYEF